jgi:hypothetical protein
MTELGQDRLGADGDAFYEKLIAAHAGLSAEESARLNTRLVLLMANQIGDGSILSAIIKRASEKSATQPPDH